MASRPWRCTAGVRRGRVAPYSTESARCLDVLALAAAQKDDAAVRALLAARTCDERSVTAALFVAAAVGADGALAALLAHGADPNARYTAAGFRPHCPIEFYREPSLMYGPPTVRFEGETPLFDAATVRAATLLLAAGADPNATSDAGLTPLDIAVRMGRDDVVTVLLAAGASVDGVDPRAKAPPRRDWVLYPPPLVDAIMAEDTRMCFLLLGHGACVGSEACMQYLRGPLHDAASALGFGDDWEKDPAELLYAVLAEHPESDLRVFCHDVRNSR